MDIDNNDEWLREFAERERAEDLSHTPPFERVWRAAERRSNESCADLVPKVVFGVAAGVLIAGGLVVWKNAGTPDSRRTEYELVALDSVLVTYWQAPSDVLLEPLSPSPSGGAQ